MKLNRYLASHRLRVPVMVSITALAFLLLLNAPSDWVKVQVEAKSEGPPASGRPWETVDDVKRAGFFPLQVGRWDSVRPLGSFAGWPQAVQAHDATGFFFLIGCLHCNATA